MATNKVHDGSRLHVLSVYQQHQDDRRCIDCQKLKNELNEVRIELKSVKEIVNILNQDLASINVHGHNLHREEHPKTTDTSWENPKHSTKMRLSESTVSNSCFNTTNRFQVLNNHQESDSLVVTQSEIPQTGKVHRNTIETSRSCEQEECQAHKVINSTDPSNSDFLETALKHQKPIPVIVNGSTAIGKNSLVKRQKRIAENKKDHKLLIIGDSHVRLWT